MLAMATVLYIEITSGMAANGPPDFAKMPPWFKKYLRGPIQAVHAFAMGVISIGVVQRNILNSRVPLFHWKGPGVPVEVLTYETTERLWPWLWLARKIVRSFYKLGESAQLEFATVLIGDMVKYLLGIGIRQLPGDLVDFCIVLPLAMKRLTLLAAEESKEPDLSCQSLMREFVQIVHSDEIKACTLIAPEHFETADEKPIMLKMYQGDHFSDETRGKYGTVVTSEDISMGLLFVYRLSDKSDLDEILEMFADVMLLARSNHPQTGIPRPLSCNKRNSKKAAAITATPSAAAAAAATAATGLAKSAADAGAGTGLDDDNPIMQYLPPGNQLALGMGPRSPKPLTPDLPQPIHDSTGLEDASPPMPWWGGAEEGQYGQGYAPQDVEGVRDNDSRPFLSDHAMRAPPPAGALPPPCDS